MSKDNMPNIKANSHIKITGVIGGNLKQLRNDAGCTQQQIAQILGVSFQQVQKYERGNNRLPSDKLYILKMFFDVPYAAFFNGVHLHINIAPLCKKH